MRWDRQDARLLQFELGEPRVPGTLFLGSRACRPPCEQAWHMESTHVWDVGWHLRTSAGYTRPSTVCSEPHVSAAPQWKWNCFSL